jgi:hypothetical protein
MDQAESEDQNLLGHHQQRGPDPGLDRLVCLAHAGLPEIQSQIGHFHATDTPLIPTQPLR